MSPRKSDFQEWLEEEMRDPEFRAAYEAMAPAYQVARLRIRRGLTQEQLARLAGTHQPEIARLESGKAAPNLRFLQRVVEAMGGCLEIRIYPQEEAPGTAHCPQTGAG